MVAPRQTFNLWSATVFFKGEQHIWSKIYEGGELYEILLYNQISILMTHCGNFGSDRLANYLLENVFELISKWTNLMFYAMPPLKLIEKYFQINTDEAEPLWHVSLKTIYLKIENLIIKINSRVLVKIHIIFFFGTEVKPSVKKYQN